MDKPEEVDSPDKDSAADPDGIALRQLSGPDDYRACCELQRVTWGRDFEGVVTPSVLKIIQRVGGMVAGAFAPDGRLLGFVLGLTGVRPPRVQPAAVASGGATEVAAAGSSSSGAAAAAPRPEIFHWSHMLAVVPEARDLGLGTRLKWYQRELLLPLGIEVVEWTYDPLEARNAHLNFNVLGAEVVEYVEDMYKGEMGSELARGIGTDRFIVSWWLDGEPGRAAVGRPVGASADAAAAAAARFLDAPLVGLSPPGKAEQEALLPDAPRVRVEVPARIQDLKDEQPEQALACRLGTRRAFETYLARGYRVTAFFRDADRRCFYGVEKSHR